MHKFTSLTAVAAPMDASNIDTDQIIPKQFLLASIVRDLANTFFIIGVIWTKPKICPIRTLSSINHAIKKPNSL